MLCGLHVLCRDDEFKCRNDGACISNVKVCNGVEDCPDGTDELGCSDKSAPTDNSFSCPGGYFACGINFCIDPSAVCDGNKNCPDGLDEKNCDGNNTVVHMGVDEHATNSSSFVLYWSDAKNKISYVMYLPSIAKIGPGAKWTNASHWISERRYQFTDLEPYTRYNITIYTRTNGGRIHKPLR